MRLNQRGIAHLFAIVLILVGLIIGVYLVQNPQIFNPKAASTEPRNWELYLETFRLENPKSELQKYLNPYGEAWENKRFKNPNIPNMITAVFDRTKGSSVDRPARQLQFNRFKPDYFDDDPWTVFPVPGATYTLDYQGGYDNLIRKANADLNVIGGGSGRASSTLRPNMPVFKIVTSESKKLNPNLKSYGYYVINFPEIPDGAGYPKYKNDYVNLEDPAQEEWFIHRKGTGTTCIDYYRSVCQRWNYTPADRLKTTQGQDLLDVTNPALQDYMADGVAKAMQDNNVDMILVDGAGSIGRIALLNGESTNAYPDRLTPAALFEGNKQTLAKIKAKINPLGKQVYFNPIQPDALDDNRLKQVMELLQVTDGSYWEDPFRVPNRDYFALNGGVDQYYNILQKFFDVFKPEQMNKKLIVETNTLRNLDTSSILNLTTDTNAGYRYLCRPEFYCEYQTAINQVGQAAWLKEEQRIARLDLGMYLLFMDPKSTYYKHHTLMEEASYETSEDFWADYDLMIGKPYGPKEKIKDNVYRRIFDNAQVWVNYSNQPYTLPNGALPCDDYHQGACRTPHFVTAEGEPVTSYTLPPFSAMIFGLPWIIEPHNPSFETVWNWKPNQQDWGSLDYSVFYTGRRAHKIPSGLSGSPGLAQKYQFLPNTTYVWSAWVKTENNQNSQTVAVMVPGGVTTTSNKINEGRFIYDDIVPKGTNGWKKIQMSFSTQQGGTGYIYSVLQGGSNGTVWFDDVRVTEGAMIAEPNFNDKTLASCNGTTPRNHLEWAQVPGATGYYIFRGQGNDPLIKIADSTNFAYNDDQVSPDVSYTYKIEAQVSYKVISGQNQVLKTLICNPGSSASPTPQPSVQVTPTPSPRASSSPVGIPLPNVTQTNGYCQNRRPGIAVAWVSVPGATSYRLIRSGGASASYIRNMQTRTSFNDEAVSSGGNYSYTVEVTVGSRKVRGLARSVRAPSC